MDRRKLPPNEGIQENDKQFLERTGATGHLKDVLTRIIENRPHDPIDFLADYFETYGDKMSRVSRAYHQINMTHHSKPAFETNIRNAYDNLSQTKGEMEMAQYRRKGRPVCKSLRGINGIIYSDLLSHFTRDFPQALTEKLMRKIQCRDHEVIVYDVFKSGIFTCLVLKDFLHQSELLYECLDPQAVGKVDKNLCDSLTKQLQIAVTNSSSGPAGVFESSYHLGPDHIFDCLTTYPPQTGTLKRTFTLEEFQVNIAESFLSKVRTLK